MRQLLSALLILAMIPSSGCALMFSGAHQDVDLDVQPRGSKLAVYQWDGTRIAMVEEASVGKLSVHRPSRAQSYLVLATREGSCPQYWLTGYKSNWFSLLNLPLLLLFLIPGMVGNAIDSNSGAGFHISPDHFTAQLAEAPACAE